MGSKKSFKEAMEEARGYLRDGDERMEDALDALQGAYDRDTRNPSHLYTFKSVQDDCMRLVNLREYHRGYSDGKKARDAKEWMLDQERRQVASRLSDSGIAEWSDEGVILRVLTRVICNVEPSVNTMKNARTLVKSLTHLLVGEERETHDGERFCERYGWCGMGSGACDGCDGKRLDATEVKKDGSVRTDGGACGCGLGVHIGSVRDDELEMNHGVTDELRDWAATKVPWGQGSQLMSIARRIDETFARVCEIWERTATEMAQGANESMEAEVESLKRECDEKHDRIIQLQEELLDARRQADSLMYDSVPATEENMEKRGWVPKKKLDNANSKIRELELDIKAQRKSICDKKKRIRGLARENERALEEARMLKEERDELQASIDEIDKHCMEVPTDKYGEAIMLGDMVSNGERVGYVTGYTTMQRNGTVFVNVSFSNTIYVPKDLFHTYESAYTMYALGEIGADAALRVLKGELNG